MLALLEINPKTLNPGNGIHRLDLINIILKNTYKSPFIADEIHIIGYLWSLLNTKGYFGKCFRDLHTWVNNGMFYIYI